MKFIWISFFIVIFSVCHGKKVDAIINMLNKYGRYDDDQDRIIKKLLEELKVLTFSRIDLTDAEKRKMVKTVELRGGHWYKCPNGHPYTIKECGRATEKSRCYECGAPISERNQALAPDNAVVTEIAGARDGALSDQAKSQVLS